MPHKRNPVSAEQICGLARVLRADAVVALENVALWHERDISHSSAERVILADATSLADYLLSKTTWIVENLHVYPENLQRNLEHTGGLIFSQRVLLALVEAGMSREEAYALVQKCAMQGWQDRIPFRQLVTTEPAIADRLDPEQLAACFDYRPHLRHVDSIFRRLGLL